MPELLFSMPNAPDDFGVLVPPADLRRIRFSALDYSNARRGIIEYIKSYFPDTFNSFVASNGMVMVLEIVAAEVFKLSLRADLVGGQAFIGTCTSEEALANHLQLIAQRVRRQTPATTDVELSIDGPVSANVEINPGSRVTALGPDGRRIVYEVYSSPGDFTSKIVIPSGKRGVIAYGLEGAFASATGFTSPGGPFQTFEIVDKDMLEAPILVSVTTTGAGGDATESWVAVSEPIEKYGPNERVVEVLFVGDKATFRFGNDVTGRALLAGQRVAVRYRAGGGTRGRVAAGQLSDSWQVTPLPPANAPLTVGVRNVTPSVGGSDRETLQQAKRRAPRDFAVAKSIVTDQDYAHVAATFSHPVFGSVAKAVATVNATRNANLVVLYCLASGADGRMTAPSLGLKRGLTTFLSDLNVATDTVEILAGALKAIDVNLRVTVSKNADATEVRGRVEGALDAFFDPSAWEMGQAFYASNLINAVQGVDGVLYADLLAPADNVLPTRALAAAGSRGVGFNELIVEGNRVVKYYYERGKV